MADNVNLDSARLVATIRRGFADEVARKVKALRCDHGDDCHSDFCSALDAVLDLLREYQT